MQRRSGKAKELFGSVLFLGLLYLLNVPLLMQAATLWNDDLGRQLLLTLGGGAWMVMWLLGLLFGLKPVWLRLMPNRSIAPGRKGTSN